MPVDYEPAPKPTPLWLLPVIIMVLAAVLMWAVQQFTDREVGGFGGRAQPQTPVPTQLADGSALPEVPEELSRRFGDDVVLAKRVTELPGNVRRRCRGAFRNAGDPQRKRLNTFVGGSDVAGNHLGPDALTTLSIGIANSAPPGYPSEVVIACVARPRGPGSDGWQATRPVIDFALDGRPGQTLGALELTAASDDAGADPQASETPSEQTSTLPAIRTRVVQVPIGTQWVVQRRGGWWLAQDVEDASWALLPLSEATGPNDPLRVVFVDATGDVVAERAVGPTRSAADSDHSTDYELVAGAIPEILGKLRNAPVRVCEPGNGALCVWLSLNELDEILAYSAFGPNPLDTPPLGYVGYCPAAGQFQGSVTTTRFRSDGTWAGGPARRGLDRYGVRFEAGMVVVDLSEHIVGEPATGEPDADNADCRFKGRQARGQER